MSQFEINITKCRNEISNLKVIENSLSKFAGQINDVTTAISQLDGYHEVLSVLAKIKADVYTEANNTGQLREALEQAIRYYKEADREKEISITTVKLNAASSESKESTEGTFAALQKEINKLLEFIERLKKQLESLKNDDDKQENSENKDNSSNESNSQNTTNNSTGNYSDFKEALGSRESTDDYSVVNQYGYMGKYQLGSLALQDIGFKDKNGNWTEKANSYGIYCQNDFLSSPSVQDIAFDLYVKKQQSYIHNLGLDKYIGQTMNGVLITESGLVAAAHLVGVGSLEEALKSGNLTSAKDGNGVEAKEYMESFGGYDLNN